MDGNRVAFAAAAMSRVVAASNPAFEKQSRAASRMRPGGEFCLSGYPHHRPPLNLSVLTFYRTEAGRQAGK